MTPPATQAARSSDGDGSAAAMHAGRQENARADDAAEDEKDAPIPGRAPGPALRRAGAADSVDVGGRQRRGTVARGRPSPIAGRWSKNARPAAMAARLATYLVVAIVAATLIAGLIVGAQRADNSGPVDLIIHNARVYAADDLGTMADAVADPRQQDPARSAASARSCATAVRRRRSSTRRGAAVLPGFDDAHASLIAGGLARDGVQLFGATTLEEHAAARSTTGRRRVPTRRGSPARGWTYDAFADLPTRAQLDAAVSDRPAQLFSQDGQARWLNTRGACTPRASRGGRTNPKHGVIVRDRARRADRPAEGRARWRSPTRALPQPTREERARALQLAIRDAQQHGITSVQDLGAACRRSRSLRRARATRARCRCGSTRRVPGGPAPTPDDLDAIAKRYPDDPLLKTGLAVDRARRLGRIADGGDARRRTRRKGRRRRRLLKMPAGGARAAASRCSTRAAGRSRSTRPAIARCGWRSTPTARSPTARTRDAAARHRIEGRRGRSIAEDMPRFGALGVDRVDAAAARDAASGLSDWSRNVGPERAPLGWAAAEPERRRRAPRLRHRLAAAAAGSARRTARRGRTPRPDADSDARPSS